MGRAAFELESKQSSRTLPWDFELLVDLDDQVVYGAEEPD
jgi:hypothetical protein